MRKLAENSIWNSSEAQRPKNQTNSMPFEKPYGLHGLIIILCCAALIVIVTAVGNILVACSVFMVRRLRQPCNFLLISLAMADMLVALVVMPLAAIYHAYGWWPLGEWACHFWTFSDVLLCTASILNLCAISVDRYCCIVDPLNYVPKRTTRRILLYIGVVWVMAFLISILPILALKTPSLVSDLTCQVTQSLPYQVYATMGAFYIPVIIILCVNIKIFVAAKRLAAQDRKSSGMLSKRERNMSICVPAAELLAVNNLQDCCNNYECCNEVKCNKKGKLSKMVSRFETFFDSNFASHHSRSRRENKAAKTLSIIMGAFITCWLPFFILALIKPFCPQCQIPAGLDVLIQWLGYINSTINPIVYPIFNHDFRVPFREILCCRCSTLQTVLRSETYAEVYGEDSVLVHKRTTRHYHSQRLKVGHHFQNNNNIKLKPNSTRSTLSPNGIIDNVNM